MADKAGKAGDATRTVRSLVKQFGEVLNAAHAARLRLGDIVVRMTKHLSWSETASELSTAYPGAESKIGHKLTVVQLRKLANIHETFTANGGIESPDGRWKVDGGELEALDLTTDQMDKLATKVRDGKIAVKRVAKAARTAAITKSADKKLAKRNAILALIDEAPKIELTPEQRVAAAKRELELASRNAKRAQEREQQARKALADAEAAMKAEDKVDAEVKVEAAKPKADKSKRGGRRGGKHSANGIAAPA